jgi:ketosteroid isomerase-like protein
VTRVTSTDAVTGWLERYVDVWRAGDPARVSELFTEDAMYCPDPFQPPRRGHAEIGEYWGAHGDPSDGFEAAYEPLVVGDDLAVVTGSSRYFDEARTAVVEEFANVFVLRFAGDGRCREYREWWMLRAPEQPIP